MPKKILISAVWLKACGMSKYEGIPFEVISEIDWGGNRGIQYNVRNPDGSDWVVFSWRGVEIVDETAKATNIVYTFCTKKLKNGKFASIVRRYDDGLCGSKQICTSYEDKHTTRAKAYHYAKQMAHVQARGVTPHVFNG